MPKSPDEYLNINQRAMQRFDQLRKEMNLDIAIPIIEREIENQHNTKVKIDREKLTSLLEGKIKSIPELDKYNGPISEQANKEIAEAKEFIEDSFSFIDSLKLPPQLSLAIGLIISANNKQSKDEVDKAIDSLANFTNDTKWRN